MHKISLENRILYASDGELLSDVFLRSVVTADHPCGGRGVCKKCIVLVNGEEVLSCQYRVCSDVCVTLPAQTEIESVSGGEFAERQTDNICLVLDVGTTTLALAAVSLDEKKMIKVITRTNPQRVFGADVISRIDHCRKHTAQPLFSVLINTVNEMISALSVPTAEKLLVAGNTTMLHLFFNVDCSAMGVAPYTPAFLQSRQVSADELGLIGVREVVSLPNISAFVGADLVAGMNCVEMPAQGKYSLFVDLGTNAEVLLFSDNEILCTAAAAGPCFEGANISQGMSATDGAIFSFSMQDGAVRYETVGNAPAVGICGTGLVDVIAELLRSGKIDETGLTEEESIEVAPDVFLEQSDVRQFQLAKSAVCSAILTLLKMKNIRLADIEKLYISGGFSAKINIANAAFVGLLPNELKERCIALNNSSLLGTVRYACEQNDLTAFASKAKYVDLALNSDFSQLFIENMLFDEVE